MLSLRDINSTGGGEKIKIARLDPWFVSGFTDGEGCFFTGIYKDGAALTG